MDSVLSTSNILATSIRYKLAKSSACTSSYSPLHIKSCHDQSRPGPQDETHQQPPQPRPRQISSIITITAATLPQPPPSCAAVIFNFWDELINTFIDPPPRQPYLDPRLVLSGNFAPVEELPPTECRIIAGSLPSCLDGAYLRNGPNPQFIPNGPYHLLDGDGMIHCLRISGSQVTLSSRYVQTYKYTVERQAGTSIIPNMFSGFNGFPALAARGALMMGRILAGHFNPVNGIGTANTALARIGGSLYALCESDLPYKIRVTKEGDVITLGRDDFNGKLRSNMTAHPKLDPQTGELFGFHYSGFFPPFLTFIRFDKSGNKLDYDIPITSLKSPVMLHDFAITESHFLFPETQIEIVLNPAQLIMRGRGGHIIQHNPDKVPRIGVISRDAKDDTEIKWFHAPGLNVLHTINAWDEVDEHGNQSIVLIATNLLKFDQFLTKMDLTHGSVEMVRIQLQTGDVSRTTLSAMNLEFGVVNPSYIGSKNRFAYAAVANPMPKMKGVVKLDLDAHEDSRSRVIAMRMYGEECFGEEPFFVARDPNNKEGEEDDGYLLSYVHNEKKGESVFVVMDARSLQLEVVAEVALPHRVPYGFHGLFVSENELIQMEYD